MKKLMFACLLAALACAFLLPGAALADDSSTTNSNEEAATSIKADGAVFGLSDFERCQVGFEKSHNGTSYGYVFPLGEDEGDDVCVVVTKTKILVYIPSKVAKTAGFTFDNTGESQLSSMLVSLDEGLSDGGTKLSSLSLPYVYTSKSNYKIGKTSYAFDVDIDGYTYVTCKIAGKSNSESAADFCLSGRMLPADQVTVAQDTRSWFDKLCDFLNPSNLDYRPLWVSLKTAGVAMIFIFFLGLAAARRSMHVKSRWKGLLDSLFTIPMVLPPTVCGFILLVIFGQSTEFGRFLMSHGIQLVFSWPAAVLAAIVVGFPLMYRTALGAFEALDVDMLDAARTLGWSEGHIFRKLMLPLAWPSIASGIVLAFARAMGEFGATLFVAGNYAGVTQTMPIAIYFAWMGGNSPVAVFWVVVVILISFVIILFINVYSAHVSRYRKSGGPRSTGDDEASDEDEGNMPAFDTEAAASIILGPGTDAGKEVHS